MADNERYAPSSSVWKEVIGALTAVTMPAVVAELAVDGYDDLGLH